MAKVQIVKIPFKDLHFMEDNPRKIQKEDLEKLAGEIKNDPSFFDSRPCLVNYADGKYLVYAGFQRAHAANKILKWKEIPCAVENDVPIEVMRRRAILDNTHAGRWNADILSRWEFEMEELEEMWVPKLWDDAEESETVDYSGKNKELDTDGFEDEMNLKFRYSKDEYMDVQERLNVVCAKQNVDTKEAALIELLLFYERNGA